MSSSDAETVISSAMKKIDQLSAEGNIDENDNRVYLNQQRAGCSSHDRHWLWVTAIQIHDDNLVCNVTAAPGEIKLIPWSECAKKRIFCIQTVII